MGTSLRTLCSTGSIAIVDWSCDGCDSTAEEIKPGFEIVFVRSGVFVADCGGEELPLTPNEVWMHPAGVPYRIRHPLAGDECTGIWPSDELLSDYADASKMERHTRATSRGWLLQHALWRAANDESTSPLEIEERTRALLEEVFDHRPEKGRDSHRKVVRRAQEVLATTFAENLSLSDVARAAGSSPYHLSRIFRAVTGQSMHRYRSALRLRASLSRLSNGETDLTSLALDLGFCDHSHFTNSFRRAFSVPPSRFREVGVQPSGA